MARCYQTICAAKSSHNGAYIAEWQHCRRIAECARELARTLDGFSPEEAYLVGLLYRLGTFPQILGWNVDNSSSKESDALGVMLAFHWNLPQYVLLAIREQQEAVSAPRWKKILQLADQLVEQPVD
jgi:HD-like signal output (HDOD) protein